MACSEVEGRHRIGGFECPLVGVILMDHRNVIARSSQGQAIPLLLNTEA